MFQYILPHRSLWSENIIGLYWRFLLTKGWFLAVKYEIQSASITIDYNLGLRSSDWPWLVTNREWPWPLMNQPWWDHSWSSCKVSGPIFDKHTLIVALACRIVSDLDLRWQTVTLTYLEGLVSGLLVKYQIQSKWITQWSVGQLVTLACYSKLWPWPSLEH